MFLYRDKFILISKGLHVGCTIGYFAEIKAKVNHRDLNEGVCTKYLTSESNVQKEFKIQMTVKGWVTKVEVEAFGHGRSKV